MTRPSVQADVTLSSQYKCSCSAPLLTNITLIDIDARACAVVLAVPPQSQEDFRNRLTAVLRSQPLGAAAFASVRLAGFVLGVHCGDTRSEQLLQGCRARVRGRVTVRVRGVGSGFALGGVTWWKQLHVPVVGCTYR